MARLTGLLRIRSLTLCAALLSLSATSHAQSSTDFDLPAQDMGQFTADGGLELADIDFTGNPAGTAVRKWPEDLVVAPIPGYSPQLGWTLALAGGYFLTERVEDGPPPSVLGGFGFAAENGSYAYGGGGNFHLMDDRLRIKVGAGYMDVRYRFYGIGNDQNRLGISLDILQKAPLYFGSASYRVWRKLYLGLGYLTGDVETRLRFEFDDPPPFFDPSIQLDIAAITLPMQWDSRDHEQFPRSGWFVDGRTTVYRRSVGSDFDAETFAVGINRYLPMSDGDVLALRAFVRSTSGDAPFFLLSTFGGSKDLRGYPSGRYRDRMMYAVQGEYRWQVNEDWIVTGFAGVGEVARDFGEIGKNFLPAGGIGVRYVLSKKHRISLSADLAAGKDGAEFYFGVGEAF
jgi:hypothetical protein